MALKTLGLAALLHQAGLRPPAAITALPVFDTVLADIGDQQSIEMSLSTFSAHVRNLIAILRRRHATVARPIDELASATDPVEGSALAQALVARLADQARLTVVTTHYPELKEWASATDGVANAATGLDPETHEPLYRVALGRPGTSHALETAQRLGLDADVVEDARARVGPERLRVAELLVEAESAERQRQEAREAAERRAVEAAARRWRRAEREAELAAEIEKVRASAAKERELAIADAERDLAAARAELDALREEIRTARRRQRRVRRAVTGGGRAGRAGRDRRLGEASTRAARAEQALRALDGPCPCTRRSRPAIRSRRRIRACAARSSRSTATTRRSSELAATGFASRSRGFARTPAAALRARSRATVRVVAAARGDVSDELDLRGVPPRKPAMRFDPSSTTRRSPVYRASGSSTAAAREPSARRCATSWPPPLVGGYESDSAEGATVASSPEHPASRRRYIGRENLRKRLAPLEGTPGRTTMPTD